MTMLFHSLQSEWMKKRGSLGSWLIWGAAAFVPAILLLIRVTHPGRLPELYATGNFWEKLWTQAWEAMATFFLPMVIILVTALVAQLEFKNNAWKQLHTTPQRYITIFLAKLIVVVGMVVQLLVLFNLGIYLSGVIPALIYSSVDYPAEAFPLGFVLREDVKFFLDCLPMIAFQYLLSLKFKNFLVPLGVGFFAWVMGIGFLSWKFSYIFPYAYTSLDHFKTSRQIVNAPPPASLQAFALAYFVIFIAAAYLLYVRQKVKG